MNSTQSARSIHHAHFPLQHCLELAERLRGSGEYGHVNIENRVCYDGEYFAKVYVEPKLSSHDVCTQLFGRLAN